MSDVESMTDTDGRPAGAPYTSRLIKATALLPDTRLMLSAWDPSQDAATNIARMRADNLFGMASASRVEDVTRIFRQRYFDDPQVGLALVELARRPAAGSWLSPLLYFFAAQADRTLRDLVLQVIVPRHRAGYNDLPVDLFYRQLREWIAAGLTTSRWSDDTIQHVGQHAAATLRDFGLLSGGTRKTVASIRLPLPALALIAFRLSERLHSGYRVLHSPEWGLFLLDAAIVERLFLDAHQAHLLSYYAAGSVVRLEFPAATLSDYARRLADRAEGTRHE